MRLSNNLWRDVPICLAIVAVVGAVLFPVFAPLKHRPHKSPCLSNVKQTATAFLIYLSDADDRFPHRDRWIDDLYPYVKNWDIPRCPFMPEGQWGYAFNGALDLLNERKLDTPATTPLLYDSVNPVKNASDLVTSLPAVPRHRLNTMAYADDHAKSLPSPKASQ